MRLLLIALAAFTLWAQPPQIGSIDFYGLRQISRERLVKELGLSADDRLPASKGDVEERLEELDGVVAARLQALCCENSKVALFVGIAERGAPHFSYRSPPGGNEKLPQAVVETYRDMLRAMEDAGRRGKLAQDLTEGHPLMSDPAGRALQRKLQELVKEHLPVVRKTLRESADEEQRAIAATVIGYSPDKRAAVDHLLYALQDPDETVRANAVRSLEAIAVLARLKPELKIRISPTWFVEMLNSLALSDRYRAARALVTLTEHDAAPTLQQIRERAWDSAVEMARWNHLPYALPAFILLGRASGLTEKQIEEQWSSGRQQQAIDEMVSPSTR